MIWQEGCYTMSPMWYDERVYSLFEEENYAYDYALHVVGDSSEHLNIEDEALLRIN